MTTTTTAADIVEKSIISNGIPLSNVEVTRDSYKGKIDPDWCPGCGDFGVLTAMQKALSELGKQPHECITISGIGCSSNLPGFINTYGMHTLHGRSLAVATGMKMANHELTVMVTGGDGDGFGIGGNHFLHTMRRNVDLTYIVMDNQIYGLTTGQTSPTSALGMQTKSTPEGNLENPINPMPLAMVGGATFVARAYTGQQSHLVDILKQAITHKGFSLVDVFSPCVTYNKDNTYQWFKSRVKKLEDSGHDRTDFHSALDKGYMWGEEIPIGVFWHREDLPTLNDLEPVLDEGGPLAYRTLGITKTQSDSLMSEMM